MNLFEAKNYVQRCKESFEKVKSLFSNKEREILDKVYLVFCCKNRQLELHELNAECLGGDHGDLLVNSNSKDWVVRLVRKKAWIEKQKEQLQKELFYVNRQLVNANENWLHLKDFTVEIRFNELDFGLIQKLKRLSITDKERTTMSRASINIIIKPLKEIQT